MSPPKATRVPVANSSARQEVDTWRTVPNLITAVRVLLIVPFSYFVARGQDLYALAIFFVASVSDSIDGTVARWLNQRSKLGRLVDPVADKVLTGVAYVMMSWFRGDRPAIPVWVMVAVITRDILILAGCAMVYRIAHNTNFKPTVFGKLNTFLELLTLGWFLTATQFPVVAAALPTLYVLVTLSILVSSVDYTRQGLAIIRAAR